MAIRRSDIKSTRLNPFRRTFHDVRRLSGGRPLFWIGAVIALFWCLAAIAAPVLAPYDPLALTAARLQGPNLQHLMGTDELGRDLLSRVIWGSRVSIPDAIGLITVSVLLGSTLGAIAGYFGGWIEAMIMRTADMFFAFPAIILAMAITASLGPGLVNAGIAIVIVSWPVYARVVRSIVFGAARSDYVAAARLLGTSSFRALVRDVAPSVVGPLVVLATLGLGNAVLLLAGLSFLGLGARPPTPEWGSMVADGTNYVESWWLSFFPGLAILSAVISFNFLGDAARDALDPRLSVRN